MAIQERDLNRTGDLQRMLNGLLADWAVMYVKLHQVHWYVKGPHFQALHEKFEELYETAASMLDELAERMVAIGMQPASTMKEYLELAQVREADLRGEKDTAMVQSIAADFGKMIESAKQAVKLAEQSDDAATADTVTGQIESLEKQTWMLNAILGK